MFESLSGGRLDGGSGLSLVGSSKYWRFRRGGRRRSAAAGRASSPAISAGKIASSSPPRLTFLPLSPPPPTQSQRLPRQGHLHAPRLRLLGPPLLPLAFYLFLEIKPPLRRARRRVRRRPSRPAGHELR